MATIFLCREVAFARYSRSDSSISEWTNLYITHQRFPLDFMYILTNVWFDTSHAMKYRTSDDHDIDEHYSQSAASPSRSSTSPQITYAASISPQEQPISNRMRHDVE